jgi:hypothetical protein
MAETLKLLESKRDALYRRLYEIGDFRRGTISANYRKCGKKNCVCTKEGHPGHGPQYLWNATINGKSYAKNLQLGTELQKYTEETERYREFMKLCNEIIRLNEQISELRPVLEIKDDDELQELKKNLQRRFMKKYRKRLTR